MAAVTATTLAAATTVSMIADTKDAVIGVAAHGAAALAPVAQGAATGVVAAAIGVAAIGKAAEKGSAAAMEMDLNGHQTSLRSNRRLASCGMTRILTEVSCGCDGFGSSLCDTIDNIHVIPICICIARFGSQSSSVLFR